MSIALTERRSDEQKLNLLEYGGGAAGWSEGMKAEPECRCKRLKCELAPMHLHGRDFYISFCRRILSDPPPL